jgi:cell division cycle 20-like protein 1 (cofactor of APC complex)
VAVGTHHGYVQVWDVAVNKQVNKMQGHSARVGALAWNGDVLSSGSRDRLILQRDVRTPSLVVERKLVGHRQEVRRKLFVKYSIMVHFIITEQYLLLLLA